MKQDFLTYSFLTLREKLHRRALNLLHDEEDAQDALQDTFSKLWVRGRINSEPEARNMLYRVLRNICIDRLRKHRAEPLSDSMMDNFTTAPDSGEDMRRFEALLTSGLSDIQRKIYALVTHEGLEYEVIAKKLNISAEACRTNMCRARKRIRDNYKKLS